MARNGETYPYEEQERGKNTWNLIYMIRFENADLQNAFISELKSADISYDLDDSGAVAFDDINAECIIDAAHRVRDAQFPWYFLKWKTQEESIRFRKVLMQAGLPFFTERHEDGTWFVVRRADQEQIEQLWPMAVKRSKFRARPNYRSGVGGTSCHWSGSRYRMHLLPGMLFCCGTDTGKIATTRKSI